MFLKDDIPLRDVILLHLLDFNDIHWANFPCSDIFFQFVITNPDGMKALFISSSYQGAFSVLFGHTPPPWDNLHTVVAANALLSLLGNDNHFFD